jgi:hypothetical protein
MAVDSPGLASVFLKKAEHDMSPMPRTLITEHSCVSPVLFYGIIKNSFLCFQHPQKRHSEGSAKNRAGMRILEHGEIFHSSSQEY